MVSGAKTMGAKGQRLLIVALLVALMAAGFLLLRDNLDGYVTPGDLPAREIALGDYLSVGGQVVAGSLQALEAPQGSTFIITDGLAELRVVRAGSLPDLFAEGELTEVHGPIIALEPLTLRAVKVLAKHDQYYVPVSAQQALDNLQSVEGR